MLHYFESREAVLLELVHTSTLSWLDDLAGELGTAPGGGADATARAARFASAFAASLNRHALFCELISAQAGVLERNISTETAIRFKRTMNGDLSRLAGLVTGAVPELDHQAAADFATAAVIMAGALWIHARPAPAVLAAYEADPETCGIYASFADAVCHATHTMLAGSISRSASGSAHR